MKRRGFWPAVAGFTTWWLTGCATAPPSTPSTGTVVPKWSGRFALKVLSAPPQSLNAGFELEGSPAAGTLRVLSPLGLTLAQATWSEKGATLTRGAEEQNHPHLDGLTTALTGTPLPVASLFAWLRGQAGPAQGWTVDLSAHHLNRLQAQREHPLPTATLLLVFEPPAP